MVDVSYAVRITADATWNPGESSVILIKVPKSFHQHRGPPTHPTYPVEEGPQSCSLIPTGLALILQANTLFIVEDNRRMNFVFMQFSTL